MARIGYVSDSTADQNLDTHSAVKREPTNLHANLFARLWYIRLYSRSVLPAFERRSQ
jgi:hypothetical protein